MRRFAFGSEFNRSILTLVTGTLLAQTIPILSTPFLTRLYSPIDFGFLGSYSAIVALLSVAISGRYEQTILLPQKDEDAANLATLSILIVCLLSLFTYAIVSFIGSRIPVSIDEKGWLVLTPIGVFLTGIYQTLNLWLNRKKRFGLLSASRVIQTLTTVFFQVVLGYFSISHKGNWLVWGSIAGMLASCILLIANLLLKDRKAMNGLTVERISSLAARYKKFPQISLWSSLLNAASVQLPILMFSQFFGQGMVGMYTLANRMLNIPMATVGSSVGQVYFQRVSNDYASGNDIEQITMSTYTKLLSIGLPVTTIIFLFGSEIFSIIFGSQWKIAGVYAEILSLWFLFVFISSPLSNLLMTLEKHRENIIFNTMLFTSRFSVILFGAIIIKNSYYTILFFGITGAIIWSVFTYYILIVSGASRGSIFRASMKNSLPYITFVILLESFRFFEGII